MPTYSEFAYDYDYVYNQADLYVLDGNSIKLLTVNFGLRYLIRRSVVSPSQNKNKV